MPTRRHTYTPNDPSELHALEERRHHRLERQRRERMRVRRQRATVVGLLTLALLASACIGAYRLFIPTPTAAAGVAAALPESDSTGMMLDAANKLQTKAHRVADQKRIAAQLAQPLKPAPGVRTIVVDKADQTVALYEASGKFLKRVPCSSGVYYPIKGTYEVTSKKPASYYPADGSRFYYFTIFTKSEKGTNIGFHSLPLDPSGNEAGDLGKPVSHGCVRLTHDMAEFVYSWAPMGAKVIVQ